MLYIIHLLIFDTHVSTDLIFIEQLIVMRKIRTEERCDAVKNIIKNVAYGFISGIVIYVISIFFSELVYFKVSDKLFDFWFYALIAVSAAFAVLILCLKNPPISQMLVRFFSSAFFMSCFLS